MTKLKLSNFRYVLNDEAGFFGKENNAGQIEGSRKRGRLNMRLTDFIKETIGMSLQELRQDIGDIAYSQGRQEAKVTQQQVKHNTTTQQAEKVGMSDDGELVRTERGKTSNQKDKSKKWQVTFRVLSGSRENKIELQIDIHF